MRCGNLHVEGKQVGRRATCKGTRCGNLHVEGKQVGKGATCKGMYWGSLHVEGKQVGKGVTCKGMYWGNLHVEGKQDRKGATCKGMYWGNLHVAGKQDRRGATCKGMRCGSLYVEGKQDRKGATCKGTGCGSLHVEGKQVGRGATCKGTRCGNIHVEGMQDRRGATCKGTRCGSLHVAGKQVGRGVTCKGTGCRNIHVAKVIQEKGTINMESYYEKLEEQVRELEILLKQNERDLERLKDFAKYRIKTSLSNGCIQYYLKDEKSGKWKYVKKDQYKLIEKIIQREYESQVNKTITKQHIALTEFLEGYDIKSISNVYDSLSKARRKMVKPIIETKENYIARWLEEHPGRKNPYPEEGTIYTSSGVFVRSKSEKIIAELLEKNGIPYSYECGLALNNGRVVYPDFTILNVRLRKTLYWEHLGLVGLDEYACKNLQKINDYDRSGFCAGDNLIVTMEYNGYKFDSRIIEEKIRRYCI